MKKIVTIFLLLAMVSSITACNNKSEKSSSSCQSCEQVQTVSPTKLTNKMTENELQCVEKHELTLLDEIKKPNADPNAEHKVSIEFQTVDIEQWRTSIEDNRAELSDEEYNSALEHIKKAEKAGGEYRVPNIILVDGYILQLRVPYEDPFYDGGTVKFTITERNEKGELEAKTYSFDTFEEYLGFIQKNAEELLGYTAEQTELTIFYMKIANEALKTGNYETLPDGSVDQNDSSLHLWSIFQNYRSEWEYDREAVEAIKDSIDEISIYDDELGETFTVHVTLPPDYDKDKTYPVFFLTDGIWRFGNCPELRKCMGNGEAAPAILVSIWYSYDIPYNSGYPRNIDFVTNRGMMLDFITDNLMPYLCENYNIDCANSTLYGHSDTGVFTHYAVFNSDKYENQPFGHYIIGSPALWGLYNDNDYAHISNDDVMNDYGYFDRNQKLNKSVFLCAGSQEDPDYADRYNGHDSTLEGVAKLKERLESHDADLTYKLYESHHYQYIPEMLVEYLKNTYPCN